MLKKYFCKKKLLFLFSLLEAIFLPTSDSERLKKLRKSLSLSFPCNLSEMEFTNISTKFVKMFIHSENRCVLRGYIYIYLLSSKQGLSEVNVIKNSPFICIEGVNKFLINLINFMVFVSQLWAQFLKILYFKY